jgi:hypothetical protein
VAIAWWAIADASPYSNDILDTDLHLMVSVGNPPVGVAASTSRDNNYELVDFVAPETGVYVIHVFNSLNSSPTAAPNYVGIAVATTRYSVYLPAILR